MCNAIFTASVPTNDNTHIDSEYVRFILSLHKAGLCY